MGIKYTVNEKFFDKWSNEMAYVLGFFYADGSMEDAPYLRGKYIRFFNTEISIVENVKKVLGSEHNVQKIDKTGLYKRKQRYLLRIGSHKLFDVLAKFGLCPNKSLVVSFPKVPNKYLGNFLRGYFDGDGCVFLERGVGSKGQKIIKKLSIIFTSGSCGFLEEMRKIVNKACQIDKNKVYISHRSFQLRYNTQESLEIFKLLYNNTGSGLFLKRKFDVFREYFKLRPQNIDKKIKKIITATW